MEYLLFVGYLLLFSWLVTKVSFFTRSGLTKSQLIIIFLLKVMVAILYGWIGIYYGGYAKMWDTWSFHTHGLYEYRLLQSDPREYFTNLFRNSYDDGMSRFFETHNSFWNDLKGNVFVKMLSVFDILSLGHYYVNVIFYSFITMFGPIAIFRVMNDAFPGKKRTILLATFLIPSFLYWTSGIHKEGMIFTGIAISMYCVYFAGKEKRFTSRKIMALTGSILMVILLRNTIGVLLFPALITWIISNKFSNHGLLVFSVSYALLLILFFNARVISSKLDFPQAVASKQHAFINLKRGKTTVPIRALEPTAKSFLENTPQAINLTLLRPYPRDVHHILSLASVIETYLLLLFFLLFILKRAPGSNSPNLLSFCLFFSFSVLLAIGFSNNNIGAIARYRSVVMPLLIIPMIARIDWLGIRLFFKKYIN